MSASSSTPGMVATALAEARPARMRTLAGTALALALLVVIYHRTAVELWTTWTTNDNYSHGPLVPLVSLVIVWSRRKRLAEAPRQPQARGLFLVALACALQVAGIRSDVFALQEYSLIAMLFGLSWTFLGPQRTRVLAFPLGYLVFMLTFPPFVMNRLSYALKEIAVRLSLHAAELLGATLRRDGMTLMFDSGTLRMENPCSGLRSLLAMLATGVAFGLYQPGAWWRRVGVVLLAIPVAIAGNAARLTLLFVVSHYAGVEKAMGPVHDLSGYLTFAVALGGLWIGRVVLTPRARPAPELVT